MDEKLYPDEEKTCKGCSHQRREHRYYTELQDNDLKCSLKGCNCSGFVEWI
ncbi:hypothetical protein BH23THE1_BH23THE1_11610 [soil metagenome]